MILVNEELEINNPENLQMIYYSVDRAYTKDLFSLIKNENQLIRISGLDEGNYTINFENEHKLLLKVIKGKHVELSGKKIASDDYLLNQAKKQNSLGVEIQETTEEYKMKI